MGKTQKKNNNLEEMMKLIQLLTAKQREKIADEVRIFLLANQTKKLENSVVPNDITMDEIVAETRKVRNARK